MLNDMAIRLAATRGDPAGTDQPVYARDDDLIRRCLAGDETAWKTLIGRYQDLIYSIPRRYGLAADDAADVYQTVCLSLWKGLAELRSEKALTSWILTTTKRQSERLALKLRRNLVDSEPALMSLPNGEPAVLARVARAEEEHRVRRAVKRLPGRCGELLSLLYLEDPPLSYDEVVEKLGLPRGSVGPTRARCLEKLRKLLKS
jgi:RNA polymerase sigma factor (sigma-70 family)